MKEEKRKPRKRYRFGYRIVCNTHVSNVWIFNSNFAFLHQTDFHTSESQHDKGQWLIEIAKIRRQSFKMCDWKTVSMPNSKFSHDWAQTEMNQLQKIYCALEKLRPFEVHTQFICTHDKKWWGSVEDIVPEHIKYKCIQNKYPKYGTRKKNKVNKRALNLK